MMRVWPVKARAYPVSAPLPASLGFRESCYAARLSGNAKQRKRQRRLIQRHGFTVYRHSDDRPGAVIFGK